MYAQMNGAGPRIRSFIAMDMVAMWPSTRVSGELVQFGSPRTRM